MTEKFTDKQTEHMRKAYNRIQRGYRTVESYWKQDIMDDDLTVVKNELETALIDMKAYIYSHGGTLDD